MRLWFFNWPSNLGGADTKVDHLLPILRDIGYDITLIANAPESLEQKHWTDKLDALNINYGLKEIIPDDVSGEIALSLCNPYFHNQGFCEFAHKKGLKVIWSSEMMWHHEGELENIKKGFVDKVLYVSEIQKQKLTYPDHLPWTITGNYINPDRFPFFLRSKDPFALGRLSRPDPDKYTENFPAFYSEITMGIPDRVDFHVMAWSKELDDKYKWYNYKSYNRNWYMYDAEKIPVALFLKMIHLFAYPLGHRFTESWGRSTVEAMLTGAIPLVYPGHHLDNLVDHGYSGFILNDVLEWKEVVEKLYWDPVYRWRISQNAADHARDKHCNYEEHKRIWTEALTI